MPAVYRPCPSFFKLRRNILRIFYPVQLEPMVVYSFLKRFFKHRALHRESQTIRHSLAISIQYIVFVCFGFTDLKISWVDYQSKTTFGTQFVFTLQEIFLEIKLSSHRPATQQISVKHSVAWPTKNIFNYVPKPS